VCDSKATHSVILSGAKNLGEFLIDWIQGKYRSEVFRFAQHDSAIYEKRLRIYTLSGESGILDFDDPILD